MGPLAKTSFSSAFQPKTSYGNNGYTPFEETFGPGSTIILSFLLVIYSSTLLNVKILQVKTVYNCDRTSPLTLSLAVILLSILYIYLREFCVKCFGK